MSRISVILSVFILSICSFGQQVHLGPCNSNSCQVDGILDTAHGGCGNTGGCSGTSSAQYPIDLTMGQVRILDDNNNIITYALGFSNSFCVPGPPIVCQSQYSGDFDNAGDNSALGGTNLTGANQGSTAGSSSVAGFVFIKGGDNSAASGGVAGSVLIQAGENNGGANPGLLSAAEAFTFSGGAPTAGDLQCPSNVGAKVVGDCGSFPGNWIGVALRVNARSVSVIVPPFEAPLNASAPVTLAHTVCAGSTAGKVTDSGGTGTCASNQGVTVGVVTDIGGATYILGDGTVFTTSSTFPLVSMNTATLSGSLAVNAVQRVAVGTDTPNFGTVASGACSTLRTVTAASVLPTDNVAIDFNSDPTSTVGYQAGAMGTIIKFPGTGNINYYFCNNTGLSLVTTGATTFNYRVMR